MKTRLLYILALLCVAGWINPVNAQNQRIIDSLMNELNGDVADTTLLNTYLTLSSEFVFNSPDTALYFTDQALDLAESLQDTLSIAECYNYFGIVGTIQGKYVTGIENFQKALEWYEKGEDLEGASILINNIGVVYG
ncbi:MAG: hypothetical protein HKN32_04305, partial [Flavobacteriales bacterium]|nr:hypothetical protein [Flavobacteriales bacterium]